MNFEHCLSAHGIAFDERFIWDWSSLPRPFRAWTILVVDGWLAGFPGRCPGLACDCPLLGEIQRTARLGPRPNGSDFLRIIDFHCPFRDRRGLERRSLAIQRCVFSAAAGSLPGFASRLSPRSPRRCAVWPLPSPSEADIAVQFHQHVIEPTHHLPG